MAIPKVLLSKINCFTFKSKPGRLRVKSGRVTTRKWATYDTKTAELRGVTRPYMSAVGPIPLPYVLYRHAPVGRPAVAACRLARRVP